MASDDLEPVRKPETTPNLDRMSIDELAAHIAALEAEIARARAEIARKTKERAAADALFRRKG